MFSLDGTREQMCSMFQTDVFSIDVFFSFKLCFWTKEKSCLLSAARFYVEIGEISSHHWLITCQLFLNANGAEGPQFSCQTAQLGVKITSIANKPRVIIIHYHFFNSKYLFSPTE